MLSSTDFSARLSCLTRERQVKADRALSVSLPSNTRKERQIEAFLEAASGQLAAVVGLFQREELKVACRQHGLPDSGRARFNLARRLLVAAGIEDAALAPSFVAKDEYPDLSRLGDVVRVCHRQSLVETVTPTLQPRRPGRWWLIACGWLVSTATAKVARSSSMAAQLAFFETPWASKVEPPPEPEPSIIFRSKPTIAEAYRSEDA